MRIAFLINNKAGSFALETGLAWLQQLAEAKPQFEFLLLTDKKALPPFSQNVWVDNFVSSRLFFSISTQWSLQKKIKPWRPDVLVTLTDSHNLATNCPQVVLFAGTPSVKKKSVLRLLRQKVAKAAALVFPSQASLAHWQLLLPMNPDRIQIVPPISFLGANPLNPAEKMICQLEYTEGRQFFMLAEELLQEEQLLDLLRAFSLFKKRQQTNMKLVIPFSLQENLRDFTNKLATYKFREDVVITGSISVEKRYRLAAAAYALIATDPFGNLEARVVEALQLEQPLLIPRLPGAEELAGPSALYTEPNNLQDFADKMMLVYKDEMLRSQLILQGKEQYARMLENAPLQRFCALLHSVAS
jgi:glycosyltransferase involved in cell wall biosynthesis